MTGALLVTTSTQGLQPLGSAAQRSFELVATTVRQRLGAEHAALFAEPVVTDHGDQIDWYAQTHGTPQRLADSVIAVPPLARENAPARDRVAPVKAPRV